MPYVKQAPKIQNFINIIGAYFRNFRINDGISLTYVAESIHMNKGFLSDLENGKRHFPEGTIQELNDFYGTKFKEDIHLYNDLCRLLDYAFNMLFIAHSREETIILKKAIQNANIYENSPAYFVFQILKYHYYLRIEKDNDKLETIQDTIESNLDALSLQHLTYFYCLIGIFYKRNSSTIYKAEEYLNKSIELSSSNSITYAYSIFQFISLYARTNRIALAYTYCEKARNVFTRLNNYTTMFYIDFFQSNCLIGMELYDLAIEKLSTLLNNIEHTNKESIAKIHHSLAWCYLLNGQYNNCIEETHQAYAYGDTSSDLSYFIPYSYYKMNKHLKCLDYMDTHSDHTNNFFKPFFKAIACRIQKENIQFEKHITYFYTSLLKNNMFEEIPLIQDFILDYYKETDNKDMMIKILLDIKSLKDNNLTFDTSHLNIN